MQPMYQSTEYYQQNVMVGGVPVVNQYAMAVDGNMMCGQPAYVQQANYDCSGGLVMQGSQAIQQVGATQTRSYTTTTTYQVPGASQTTAKFKSSRSGRIEPPTSFAVQETYEEEVPVVQQQMEMHYVHQPVTQVQYVQQAQMQCVQQPVAQVQYVQQPMAQVQCVQQQQYAHVVQQQPVVSYMEVEGPPQFMEVPGVKQYVEIPQPPLVMEVEGPPQIVQVPSPRQVVPVVSHAVSAASIPMSYGHTHTTTVQSVGAPCIVGASSTVVRPPVSPTLTSLQPPKQQEMSTVQNAQVMQTSTTQCMTSTASSAAFHVAGASPGRSSLPQRCVTPEMK